ncbi:MAG TPA: RcnB family protein [Sphingomicrobium sp.]|nr:RcnB family protein [Sphingomicrobium sp.]
MKKLILLAATAAMIVPGTAIAQRHDRDQRDRTEVRQDHRTVQANRRAVRSDRRTVQANRQAVRSERRVARADQRVAHANRRALQSNRQVVRSERRVRSAYVAPVRNWTYRPVSVGYQLQSAFFSPRYYISDYGLYHLQAPRNRWLRWIRYGDDLLLVNIRTGRVLQVVHYRFW